MKQQNPGHLHKTQHSNLDPQLAISPLQVGVVAGSLHLLEERHVSGRDGADQVAGPRVRGAVQGL